jgi:uncharacterized repeat protein (TIGR01451 family)
MIAMLACLVLCSCRSIEPARSSGLVPAATSVAVADDPTEEAEDPFGSDETSETDEMSPPDDAREAEATTDTAEEPEASDDAGDAPESSDEAPPTKPTVITPAPVPALVPQVSHGNQVRLINPGPNPASNRAIDRTKCRVPVVPLPPQGAPIPQGIVTPWRPPGISGPWPADEYIWDGGEKYPVIVDANLNIKGLALEDTLVHYDTIDGRTVVEPSNRVVIYAPRFGAVRQVTSPMGSHQDQGLVQADKPTGPIQYEEGQLAGTALQPVQPVGEIGTKLVSIERGRQLPLQPFSRLRPATMQDHLLPFEDVAVIRNGIITQSEQAEVHRGVQAAITWTTDQAVQAILDKQFAAVEIGDQRAQVTFTVNTPNHPRLRVIKLASTSMARPGDYVDFTIRYDNIGDQTIGNVTLVDNLTTRLEFVDGTAESSLAADFFTNPNDGDSLLLRWEFVNPLAAGEGGIVRFRCRVR